TCATPALGCWKQLPNPEVTSVNAVALKTGKILLMNRGTVPGQQLYQLYDPVTDTFSPSPPALATVPHRMYCAGFDQVGESGDVLFAGSVSGADLKKATIYHPATDTWTAQPDMVASRFYPTLLTVSRRDLLAIDGVGEFHNIPERFRIRFGDWESLFGAEYGAAQPPPNDFELPNYPRFHVLSTGELIYTGSREGGADFTRLFDPLFETWRTPFAAPDAIAGRSGVMYDSDTILKAGPTQTWTLQATTPGAVWQQRASMNQTRNQPFFVALPDGKVLALGNVTTPEIWDPEADTWTNMAPAAQARADHSGAVLLPDGRVIHAGPTLTAEVYSPPYLWTAGGALARRPAISSVTGPSAGVIQYGEEFGLTSKRAAVIDTVRLIRLGAATHSWDMGQQSMLLSFRPACCDPAERPGFNGNPICFEGHTCCANGEWECNQANGTPNCPLIAETETTEAMGTPALAPLPVLIPSICTKLFVEAPQDSYQSPPGYHYLFIVEDGVPSKAAIVKAVVTP
ncbi:MAG TPA: galactose oxidase-like domain-containing protein, partial [Methylomirabilota bacterium]